MLEYDTLPTGNATGTYRYNNTGRYRYNATLQVGTGKT